MGPQKGANVRETDDYLESSTHLGEAALIKPWVRNLLQPLVVGVMVACIAVAIAQFARLFRPDWSRLYFVLAPVLAALVGHYTNGLARRRHLSGTELLRFQLTELLAIFVLLKIAGYFDDTLPEIWADIRAWPQDWVRIIDPQTFVAFLLCLGAWFLGWATVNDIEEMADPFIYQGRDFYAPVRRITQRFLIGGLVLLFFSGSTRTEYVTMLNVERPNLPGLAFNALIYFVGGLILLGQLRFARLVRVWRARKTTFSPELSARWVRYTLALLGLVLVVAFLLPTSYTLGLMDLVTFIITIATYVLSILYFLLLIPISFLLSLFIRNREMVPAPSMPTRPSAPAPPPDPVTQSTPWLEVLRSVAFWVVILGVLVYLVRSYLRDRPDLWQALQRFRPFQIVAKVWRTLRTWWRGLRQGLEKQVARVVERLRQARDRGLPVPGLGRRRGDSLRERAFYYYLTTLDRAGEEGLPRRQAQTPYEYRRDVDSQVPEAQAAMSELTEVFVEARYSAHDLDAETIERLQDDARRVQSAIKARRSQSQDEDA